MSRLATRVSPHSHRVGPVLARLAVAFILGLSACAEHGTVANKPPPAQAKPAAQAPQGAPVTPVTQQPVKPVEQAPPAQAPATGQPATPSASGTSGQAKVNVAILLPLSGPNAALGKALLNAAQMALYDVGGEGFALSPRDTETGTDGAAAAARAALADGAKLILGPLFSASVAAVAPVAKAGGVNVVAFSNDARQAAPGVYIMGFLPRAQVDRVVAYARGKGMTHFGALVPSNPYGQEVEDGFRQAVEGSGGDIVDIETYETAGKDATEAVKQLAKSNSKKAGGIGYDAIMVPDGGDRLLAIGPLFPYYDLDPTKIKLLGSGQWDDPRLAKEPSLVGGWYAASDPQIRADFEQRYASLYGGAKPPLVATLAYDATALATALARSPSGPDFSVAALTNPNGFSGLTGVFRFRDNGLVERNLAVLEVSAGGAKVIDPAATSFVGGATQTSELGRAPGEKP